MSIMKEENLDFYKLVERALEGLPPELSRLLDNVAIVVDDWPDYSTPLVSGGPEETLYGLYEGVPLTERGADTTGSCLTRSRSSAVPWSGISPHRRWRSRSGSRWCTRSRTTSASTRSAWRSWGGGEPQRQREHRAADGSPSREGRRLRLGLPQRQGVDGRR